MSLLAGAAVAAWLLPNRVAMTTSIVWSSDP